MPDSSCSLIHIKVDSFFFSLSESPESFQAGQSFSVSANQLGFGKLPAVVALNILAISLNILLNSTHFKSTIQ